MLDLEPSVGKAEGRAGDYESEIIMSASDPTPEPHSLPVEPDNGVQVNAGEHAVQPRAPKADKAPREVPEPKEKLPVTKLGRIWTATVLGIIVLILLIIFIAQNQDQVTLRYFTYEGQVNLGLALFIAAVGGALVVAIAGVARVIQLRATAKKKRKAAKR